MSHSYIIGTGWWCPSKDHWAMRFGNRLHNTYTMSQLWYNQVSVLTNPKKIVVVDSNSPVKPAYHKEPTVEFISLPDNFRSPPYKIPEPCNYGLWARKDLALSAAFRQIYLGAFYALMSEVEYFVYIEQDVLIRGEGIIEKAIDNMQPDKNWSANTTTYMPDGIPRIEACFLIVKCDQALKLCQSYLDLEVPKIDESVEGKFWALAHSVRFNWTPLPFEGTRDRPLNLKAEHCFVHKPNEQEIQEILSP